MESDNLLKRVIEMIELLKKIEANTKPEKIKETKSKITGFELKGGTDGTNV